MSAAPLPTPRRGAAPREKPNFSWARMKAALAIGAVYGLLARRACPCRFLLDGCLAAQSPSSARRAQIADRVGMYDIGSRGADRGVDPANGVGSRCDTQGSAKASELSAFLAAQHTVRLSDNRLHRLPQALDRVGNTLRIKRRGSRCCSKRASRSSTLLDLRDGMAGGNHRECAAAF